MRTSLGVGLGGLTSSALSFLLIERFNRPVFVVALSGAPTEGSVRLGLRRRLMLIWALGAAVPVLVIVSTPAGLSASQRSRLPVPLLVIGGLGLVAGLVLTTFRVAIDHRTDRSASPLTAPLVESGELDVEVPVNDGGEIGLLQAGFNRMVAGLRERSACAISSVATSVSRLHARRSTNRRDWAASSGGERPLRRPHRLDRRWHNGCRRKVVARAQRVLLGRRRVASTPKTAGSTSSRATPRCVCSAPRRSDDHPAEALRAAARCAVARGVGAGTPLDAGIGVSSGTVVAGHVGAEERYEYTVIGDPVNEAARLTEAAKSELGRVLAERRRSRRRRRRGPALAGGRKPRARGRADPTELYTPRAEA